MLSNAVRFLRPVSACAWRSLPAQRGHLAPCSSRRGFAEILREEHQEREVAQSLPKKRPPRRWMSVQDLVTEVEQALVEGERLDEDSQAYANLRREALSLRLENDALGEKVAELEEARARYIAQEEALTEKLKEDGAFFAHEKDIMEMTGKIQEVDYKIAGLRHKHHHNVKDVGSLKRTMSLIEKRGKVTTLIDATEEALDRGEVSHAMQLEADLTQVVERLRQESAKVWPKISSYEANIAELSKKMSETQSKLQAVLQTPTREADDLRTHLKGQINQVKRMLAQLGRLRDIQRVNAQEIGMVERERAKLQRYCLVRELLQEGDKDKLQEKIKVLQEDTDRLRMAIKELESGLRPMKEQATAIINKLRSMPFEFTTETGKLREQLIANIHQESQWKERLAVLRGEKLQNIRFIAMLMKAIDS